MAGSILPCSRDHYRLSYLLQVLLSKARIHPQFMRPGMECCEIACA